MSTAAQPRVATGGPPRFFALCATADGTLLAGSCGRGVSRATDGGATWRAVDPGPGSGVVNALTVTATGELLAATGDTGLHRSTDGGATWSAAGLDGMTVFAAAEVGGVLLAGTDGHGLWRSRDGGRAWSPVPGAPPTVYRVVPLHDGGALLATDGEGVWRVDAGDAGALRPSGMAGAVVFALVQLDDGTVLAGTRGAGVHASGDGGRTWSPSSAGLPDPVVHTLVAGRGVVDAGAVDAGVVDAGTGLGVARSVDAGRTWAPVGRALAHHRIFSLARTDRGGLLAGSYDGVWALAPGADDWIPVDTGLRADDALRLLVEADGAVLAATSTGGLRSLDDGVTWARLGGGLGEGSVYAFARLASGRLLAGTNHGIMASDITASDRPGGRWQQDGLADQRVYRIVEPEPGLVLAGTLGGGLWIGDGTGDRWRRAADVAHDQAFDVCRARDGALLVATGTVEAGEKTGGVFRSDDGGTSWQPAACPAITVYRIVEASDGTLLAGAQRSRLLRSADGGRTWRLLPDTTGLVDAKLFCLTIDAADRHHLGAGAHLLCSDDGAASWQPVDEGLDGASVFDVARTAGGTLLAATSWGVYRSTDDGLSWRPTARPAPAPGDGPAGPPP